MFEGVSVINTEQSYVLMLLLLTQGFGCRTRDGDSRFWASGGRYAGQFRITQRSELTPERAQALKLLLDSIDVTIQIDSIHRDSLYGTYQARLAALGLMASPVDGSRNLAGRFESSSFEIELNPWVNDAGLWLRGRLAGALATGTWQVEHGVGQGTFTIGRP